MAQRNVATLAIVFVAGWGAIAQDRPASPEPAFEVASVKANVDDLAPEGLAVRPDGSARFTGLRVRTLITMAYRSEGLQRFDQLVGGPSWISVDRFDIAAIAAGDPGAQEGPNRLPAMLRSLLRERFQLRVHSETRPMPAYGLVVARRDGRLGPKLSESTIDCSVRAGTAPANTDPDWRCGIRATGGVITGRGVSTAQLAGNLSGYPTVDRFVTDRTGLTRRYDFTLEYSPDVSEPGAVSTAGPSLFTALTEQLGLRLQAETVVLPVLIIDNVEKPTPD
ncbi:MAG TPA: TIGR03435 family protein [Vicinamibacterales bacterium]